MQEKFDRRCSPASAIRNLHAVRLMLEQDVSERLLRRGQTPRCGSDDHVFANFNTSLAIGFSQGLASYYVDLARDLDETVLMFEQANATEVHKGSLYFNAAVCALVNHDFDAALHYFTAAGDEDHKTHSHGRDAMFLTNGLFRTWVTDKLHAMLAVEIGHATATTAGLLPHGYQRAEVDNLLGTLPIAVLGAVIVSLCRYMTSRAFGSVNEGTAIVRYRVVADLCVSFETTLKTWVRNRGGTPRGTLGAVLRHDLGTTSVGDISTYANSGALWACGSLSDYDMHLGSGILASVDAEADRLKKAAKLLNFVTHTRNQVVHDLEPSAAIFQNDSLRQDVARRVLVAFCLAATF